MCKFARSKCDAVKKFKLTQKSEEPAMENLLQQLATEMSPLYQQMAPDSFHNMNAFTHEAENCRIGYGSIEKFDEKIGSSYPVKVGKPFSGVTIVSDFSAHAHRDNSNMNAGCTVVSSRCAVI